MWFERGLRSNYRYIWQWIIIDGCSFGNLNLPHLHRWMRFSQLGYAAAGGDDLIISKQMIARRIFGKSCSCAVARRDTGTTRSGDRICDKRKLDGRGWSRPRRASRG